MKPRKFLFAVNDLTRTSIQIDQKTDTTVREINGTGAETSLMKRKNLVITDDLLVVVERSNGKLEEFESLRAALGPYVVLPTDPWSYILEAQSGMFVCRMCIVRDSDGRSLYLDGKTRKLEMYGRDHLLVHNYAPLEHNRCYVKPALKMTIHERSGLLEICYGTCKLAVYQLMHSKYEKEKKK